MSYSLFRFYRCFIILCFGFGIIPELVYGSDVSKTTSPPSAAVSIPYSIVGKVVDTTADLSIEGLMGFAHKAYDWEAIRKDNGEEFSKYYLAFLNPRINRPGVTVILKGDSIQRDFKTGQDGGFRFENIPAGEYKITARAPALFSTSGEARMAVGFTDIRVPSSSVINIIINAYSINIKGRILTSNGQPIARARVTGKPFALRNRENSTSGYMEVDNSISVLSDEAGNYELIGFMPMPVDELAGYLRRNSMSRYVEIHAEAPGFMQASNQVPKIIPVSPELVPPARRLLYFFLLYAGKEIYGPVLERDDLPIGEDSTISEVDITLVREDSASLSSAKVPPESD